MTLQLDMQDHAMIVLTCSTASCSSQLVGRSTRLSAELSLSTAAKVALYWSNPDVLGQ